MIQIHSNTILSMGVNPIIKAHDSNPWQIIYQKPSSHWQYQKSSFHWQHQKAQFSLAISKIQFTLALFYQKPKIINAWQKYYVIIISFKR